MFTGVTQAHCVREPVNITMGTKYDGKVFEWLNTVTGNVKSAIHWTFHTLSNRHLPHYLADYCYRFIRRFQIHTIVDWLTYVALRTYPDPQRLLKLAQVRW